MRKLRERLTYANVMVTVLAFVVLGGSAWALSRNTVGTKQLKANAVHTGDIADDAVIAPKVKDGSLLGADFAAGQLPATNVTVRSVTQAVPMSCTEFTPIPPTTILTCTGQATIKAPCNAGERATGGGFSSPAPPATPGTAFSTATAGESRPDPVIGTPDGWSIRASATGTNSGTSPVPHPPDPEITVHAVCAS